MPEAAINKDDPSALSKDQIGLSRQTLVMKPVAKAHREYETSYRHLGGGIFRLDAAHEPATPFGGQPVHSSI